MSSTRNIPGPNSQDLVDNIMELKMKILNAPLSSTPPGQHAVHKSMTPISTVVGGPEGGDDGHSNEDSDHDDNENDRDEGRREKGRDLEDPRTATKRKRIPNRTRDNGPRRRTSRCRRSHCTTSAPKMPGLDPRNYYWNGNTAFLRYYIEKWRRLLHPSNYSPAEAVNFMLSCVPINKKYIINDCSSLTEILNKLSLHTTDPDTFLLRTISNIKAYPKPTTYIEDKKMLDFFDEALSNITKLNSAFVLNYLTAQIMCNKLSTSTMRKEYIDMLTDLKIRTDDNHKINNYLSTMQQVIVKCKVEIEDMVNINQDNPSTDREVEYISVYSTQEHGRNNGYRDQYNSHRRYQESYYNRRRGEFQNYKNNEKPINQDERGNLLYDYYGNPIDTSQDPDAAFAIHYSSLEGNREYDKGQGSNTGLGRGHDREQEYNKVPREESHQRYGSSPREGKGAQYDSRDQITNYGTRRYCMVCKEQGHISLLHCSKLPQYIPIGNNFKPTPKGLCQICLSTAVNSKDCTHNYPKDYNNWLCQKSRINFILCKNCDKHLPPQNWLKEKFKPHIGHRNLSNIWKVFKNDLIN